MMSSWTNLEVTPINFDSMWTIRGVSYSKNTPMALRIHIIPYLSKINGILLTIIVITLFVFIFFYFCYCFEISRLLIGSRNLRGQSHVVVYIIDGNAFYLDFFEKWMIKRRVWIWPFAHLLLVVASTTRLYPTPPPPGITTIIIQPQHNPHHPTITPN